MKLQVADWFKYLIDHFWNIRKQIRKEDKESKEHLGSFCGFHFGEPDFADLPKEISNIIPDKVIYLINRELVFILNKVKTKKQFIKAILKLITNDAVIIDFKSK